MSVDIRCVATAGILAFLPVVALAATGDQRLADAVERRDAPAIRTLLKSRADVNGLQADGGTALHWAAHWDDAETAGLLLRAGADVNAANDHGVTALALACENGNAAMVETFLSAGANANAAVSSGETVLMTAARTGNVGTVRALIARGANVNARERSHAQTALMWAASHGHADAAKALLEAGAEVTARSEVRSRMVHTGFRFGDRGNEKGSLLMDLGGFTPLLFAVNHGSVDTAKVLLAAGAKATELAANGASAMALAALAGRGAMAAFLLEQGGDPNAAGAGYTPLHAAVLHGDTALAKALLAKGADPNARLTKGTPSRYYSKDYAFNEALIGGSPLYLAARYGDPAMVRLLGGAGADPHALVPDGTTARVLGAGPEPQAAPPGSTLLIAAVSANGGFGLGDRREFYMSPADVVAKVQGEDERVTLATLKALLELGCDVNGANQAGDTALHVASGAGLASVVQLLADKGAGLEAKNKRGLTPLAVAIAPRARGPFAPTGPDTRVPVAALLRKLGAQEPPPLPAEPAAVDPRYRPAQ